MFIKSLFCHIPVIASQDTTGQISAVLEHIVDHDHILVQSYQYSKLCWARPQLEVWMILVQRLMQCHFIAMARSLLPCLAAHNEQWILSTCVKRHNAMTSVHCGWGRCVMCACCSSESQHLHKVSLSAENTSTHDCLNKHGYNCKSPWRTLECRFNCLTV